MVGGQPAEQLALAGVERLTASLRVFALLMRFTRPVIQVALSRDVRILQRVRPRPELPGTGLRPCFQI